MCSVELLILLGSGVRGFFILTRRRGNAEGNGKMGNSFQFQVFSWRRAGEIVALVLTQRQRTRREKTNNHHHFKITFLILRSLLLLSLPKIFLFAGDRHLNKANNHNAH
jgi:hypothetical protein